MKCKEFENLMVLHFMNEIKRDDRIKLKEHLKNCVKCQNQYQDLKKDFGILRAISIQDPQFDWNKSWRGVKEGIEKKSTATYPNFQVNMKWILPVAASVIIFTLGIFVGKFFLSSSRTDFDESKHLVVVYMELKEYLEDVTPTILEYSNWRKSDDDLQLLDMERSRIRKLLIRNHLLRNAVKGTEDLLLKELLEDLEIILVEISNLQGQSSEYLLFIKNLLKKKQIINRIGLMKPNVDFI